MKHTGKQLLGMGVWLNNNCNISCDTLRLLQIAFGKSVNNYICTSIYIQTTILRLLITTFNDIHKYTYIQGYVVIDSTCTPCKRICIYVVYRKLRTQYAPFYTLDTLLSYQSNAGNQNDSRNICFLYENITFYHAGLE